MYTHGGTLPGRAPFTYLLLLPIFGRSWQEIPHILKHPSRIYLMTGLRLFSTEILTGGLRPPFLKYELKHRLTQCLSLVRSNFTVTIQYVTSDLRYYNTIWSVTHLILLLTIYLRIYPIFFYLLFDNGRTITSNFSEGLRSTSV